MSSRVLIAFLFCYGVSSAVAQKTATYEIGLSEIFPKTTKDPITISEKGNLIGVKSGWFHRQDIYPFPTIAQKSFVEYLLNNDKWSLGAGYSLFHDYLIYPHALTVSPFKNGFTVKMFEHELYGKVLWHMKHDKKNTVFGGVKAGVSAKFYSVWPSAKTNSVLTKNEYENIRKNKINEFSAGVTCGLMVGLKLNLLKGVFQYFKKESPLGLRFTLEYLFSTPSRRSGYATFNSKGEVATKQSIPEFIFNSSGLFINVSMFAEIPRKKINIKGF